MGIPIRWLPITITQSNDCCSKLGRNSGPNSTMVSNHLLADCSIYRGGRTSVWGFIGRLIL